MVRLSQRIVTAAAFTALLTSSVVSDAQGRTTPSKSCA
jgi:hypothetical protein